MTCRGHPASDVTKRERKTRNPSREFHMLQVSTLVALVGLCQLPPLPLPPAPPNKCHKPSDVPDPTLSGKPPSDSPLMTRNENEQCQLHKIKMSSSSHPTKTPVLQLARKPHRVANLPLLQRRPRYWKYQTRMTSHRRRDLQPARLMQVHSESSHFVRYAIVAIISGMDL